MNNIVQTLSVMVTYQCNVACKHCGPYCGPEERDWMSLDEMKDVISQAERLGVFNVVFTGGEPTLLKENLVKILRFVKEETSIRSSRMVTNAKWATSYDVAYSKLSEWKEAGLDELNISCGEFHQEWVPIGSIKNAFLAARNLKFQTVLIVGEFIKASKGKYSKFDFEDEIGEKLIDPTYRSKYSNNVSGMQCSSAMAAGRGKKYILEEDTVLVDERQIKSTCSDVNSIITIHPNGNVTACCGVMVRDDSLLTIGNWRKDRLEKIVEEANDDIILNWIKYLGLHEMKKFLQSKDSSLKFKNKYASICDLCAELIYNKKHKEILLASADEKRNEILVNKIAHQSTIHNSNFRYESVEKISR